MKERNPKEDNLELTILEKSSLPNVQLVPLAHHARLQRIPNWEPFRKESGTAFNVVTVDDLPVSGFIKTTSRQLFLDPRSADVSHLTLQAYDFLITTHHQSVKMGIVNKDLAGPLVAEKNIILIRFNEEVRENAFALYVFLKTELGEKIMEGVKNKGKKYKSQIPVHYLSSILIPKLNATIIKEAIKAFDVESKFHNKILDIQTVIEGIFIDYLTRIQENS